MTFDDGYLDNLVAASPLLAEFGVPATFFVNADRLDTPHETWWDVLVRIFLCGADVPASLDLFGDRRQVLAIGASADREPIFRTILERLHTLPAADRASMMRRLCDWSGLVLSPRETHRVMTADELRQLASRPGHSVGAHTVHHLSLPAQPAVTQLREIADSIDVLTARLGRDVRAFVYPYGEYDGSSVQAARAAGVGLAVTVDGGLVGRAARPLLIPRIEISLAAASRFEQALAESWHTT